MKWTRHTDLALDGTKVLVERAMIKTSPALTKLEANTLTPGGWLRRDNQPTAYTVRYTDRTTFQQSYEVGGLVIYYNRRDSCLLFVSLVSAPEMQPSSVAALNLSTVRVAGVRWPYRLTKGKGIKARQLDAATRMMAAHGALLDDDAWVQVPYWTKAGRARMTRLAMREFNAGKLRNPDPVQRNPYRKLAGRFLSFHGVWESGTATVRITGTPGKVSVGRAVLDVVRQAEAVELHNTVLGCPVWSFTPSEFARLEKVLP